ncbi:MAG TPA: DMT family transporter [Rhizomicrobium sp.]
MTLAATTSALGLSAAVIWGASDFCGGLAARHLRVFWLLAISHAFSLAGLLALAFGLHQPRPGAHILALGFYAGLAGGIALLTFYHALSLGEMGTTAALTGLLTAALPVAFALATIGAPNRRQIAGFALAAVAIWLISGQSGSQKMTDGHERKRLALAVVSGLGFGAFLVFLRQANGGGLIWPLASARVGSLGLAIGGGLIFSRGRFAAGEISNVSRQKVLLGAGIALAIMASICDTSGNFLFIAATRTGRLDVAAVLASLYPASTILLAMWILKERASRRQTVGMISALVAVALIS